ncbi:NrfD/PsrC family molybdoenzyme membrane anchor subunit [Thermomonospora catenispora]|uniref:NrfD/PsrC family molybdoenzyme membrane anchor subunit n=1 Tax=Thermomonospora catenispora TaxID=2493090 RepID=UPI0011226395|nr:NrfD/PsrC family molybdoenzyme membrane anchor subunit [Thermomonospora catenispora]TNY38405.1 polysulfide reductase [Thermomonospora catenispora]
MSPRRRREAGGERPTVPAAEFASYYGRPVLKPPVWRSLDIAGYFFLGGLAGASSALAAGASWTGRPVLARNAQVAAVGAVGLSTAALVHDLGRPARFGNMLRVAKPTSPMSVGSWLLAAYGPLAGAAALSTLTGRLPRLGRAAGTAAAVLGPAVAAYTAVLIADTAVPAWHEAHRELPFLFAGSAAAAAGGLGLLTVPPAESGPARLLSLAGAATELTAATLIRRRLGLVARPYRAGRGGRLLRAAEGLTLAATAAAAAAPRRRLPSALAGVALLTGSALTRFGVFHAGVDSARDPVYTVRPQRERLRARRRAERPASAPGG